MSRSSASAHSILSSASAPSSAVAAELSAEADPHAIEQAIARRLRSIDAVRFSALSVHRLGNCVCVEGLAEQASAEELDLRAVLAEFLQVGELSLINHVMVCQPGLVDDRPGKPR